MYYFHFSRLFLVCNDLKSRWVNHFKNLKDKCSWHQSGSVMLSLRHVLKKNINMQVLPFAKQLQRNPFQFSTEYRKVKSGF
jgi:hypothetical protein